jgi:hypothetical protein
MPYVMLFLNRLWWVVQNLLILHLQIIGTYFQCLSVWCVGDRITDILIEDSTYTAYRKDRLDEHMGTDEDAEEEDFAEEDTGGEDDGPSPA